MERWTIYYDHYWHFLITIVTLVVTELAVLYMICRAIYNFWFNKHKSCDHDKDIQLTIKLLTLLYLILLLSFVTSSLFIRIFVVYFNGEIVCWVADSMTLWFVAARLIAHFIYLVRLYTSFNNTVYSYSNKLLIIIGIVMFVGAIMGSIWFFSEIYNHAHGSSNSKICNADYNYNEAALPFIIWDSAVMVILVSLFIHKLVVLVKITDRDSTEYENTKQKYQNRRSSLLQSNNNNSNNLRNINNRQSYSKNNNQKRNSYNITFNNSKRRASQSQSQSQSQSHNNNNNNANNTNNNTNNNAIIIINNDTSPTTPPHMVHNNSSNQKRENNNNNNTKRSSLRMGLNSSNNNSNNHSNNSSMNNNDIDSQIDANLRGRQSSITSRTQRKTQFAIQTAKLHNDVVLIRVISKFTVLVCVAVFASFILLSLGGVLPAVAVCIDGYIYGLCILYCLKTYDQEYKRYCKCCAWLGFRCCACVLFYNHASMELEAEQMQMLQDIYDNTADMMTNSGDNTNNDTSNNNHNNNNSSTAIVNMPNTIREENNRQVSSWDLTEEEKTQEKYKEEQKKQLQMQHQQRQQLQKKPMLKRSKTKNTLFLLKLTAKEMFRNENSNDKNNSKKNKKNKNKHKDSVASASSKDKLNNQIQKKNSDIKQPITLKTASSTLRMAFLLSSMAEDDKDLENLFNKIEKDHELSEKHKNDINRNKNQNIVSSRPDSGNDTTTDDDNDNIDDNNNGSPAPPATKTPEMDSKVNTESLHDSDNENDNDNEIGLMPATMSDSTLTVPSTTSTKVKSSGTKDTRETAPQMEQSNQLKSNDTLSAYHGASFGTQSTGSIVMSRSTAGGTSNTIVSTTPNIKSGTSNNSASVESSFETGDLIQKTLTDQMHQESTH